MGRVRFSDVVKRVNVFVDREHTDLLYYVDARVAENSGDKAEAETFYLLSGGFFDSAKRLILLQRLSDFRSSSPRAACITPQTST